MELSLPRILFFCLTVSVVRSARDPNVCEVDTESNGLIPPVLPVNFELKGEFIAFLNKSLAYQELYYDHLNLRAKYFFVSRGLEYHHIFDYSVGQILQYVKLHPGVSYERDPLSETCTATRIEDSPLKYIFGYRNSNRETKLTHMFNSFEALRFGGPYQYRADGTYLFEDRGLRTNVFVGCVYDETMDATLATDYFFSNSETLMGVASTQIDGGIKTGLSSVPVMAKFNGTINVQTVNGSVRQPFITEQNIAWFKADPDFSLDTFKIPEGMFCTNFKGAKPFPELPITFAVRREYTSYTQDAEGKILAKRYSAYESIWYDAERGLARRDFTSRFGEDADIIKKFGADVPMKTIFDFNLGIVYIIGKDSGRCYARPISGKDFFNTRKESAFVAMASPQELFEMDYDKMEYKGKDIVRGLDSDVWAAKYCNPLMNKTHTTETYISATGWEIEASEEVDSNVLLKHVVFTDIIEDEFTQAVEENNFFQFKASKPPNVMYDIHTSSCIDDVVHMDLGIKLELVDEDFTTIMNYRFFFLDALQLYLTDISNIISPLRIQRLNFLDFKNQRFVVFSLLDSPLLEGNVPFAKKGANAEDAITNLRTYIDSGNFTVIFKDSQKQEHQVKANPGSLGRFEMSIQSVVFFEPTPTAEVLLNRQKRVVMPYEFADIVVPPKPTVVKGMSPGGLAALAIAMIFIGIGVGIALMYLYIRKYSDQSRHDQYAMK